MQQEILNFYSCVGIISTRKRKIYKNCLALNTTATKKIAPTRSLLIASYILYKKNQVPSY